MTLSRQLVMLLTALLLLVFAGTFLITVQNARTYLELQLESHAQDAATSLGLSVSRRIVDDDLAMATSMVDAIFDRGYYQIIRIENIQGGVLINRELSVQVEDVPAWFIEHLPLKAPKGEALIMAGWRQAGRVLVQSHPGFAYRQLWENVTEVFGWFVVSALLVMGLGLALLRRVLSPLKEIEWQADAICNREFPILEKLPHTRDLRRIVEAMNRLSTKLRMMLTEHEDLAAKLRKQAHQHPVSGLANKLYFMAALKNRMTSPEVCSHAVLALIQLRDLKGYNHKHGYAAGDELLRQTVTLLRDIAVDIPRHTLGHLSGGDFVLLAEDYSIAEGEALGQRIAEALAGLNGDKTMRPSDNGHLGIVYYDGTQEVSQLLIEADKALRCAQSKGANGWALFAPEDAGKKAVRGASEWRSFIQQALADNRVTLHLQPVYSCPEKSLLHYEVLVRLISNDDAEPLLVAGAFMPMAESLGLSSEIDKAVIAQALQLLEKHTGQSFRLAINISPSSLQSEGFLDWLEGELWRHRQAAKQITFELPEYGAVTMLERVHELIKRTGSCGSQVALDHFGRGFSSFAYLHSLKISYLKVDGGYLSQIDKNPDHRFFIQALTDIAHGLDIEVIAEAVESEITWHSLQSLHVDGAQGYYLGRPEPYNDIA